MSREESKSTFPDDIKVIKSDYSESSLADAFKGQDAVVSTISGGALQDQFKIIDAAVKAGVKRFIPSEFGSDSTNKAGNEICPIFEGKLKAVEHLKQKADGNPNFSWTGVMTGPFFGESNLDRCESRTARLIPCDAKTGASKMRSSAST